MLPPSPRPHNHERLINKGFSVTRQGTLKLNTILFRGRGWLVLLGVSEMNAWGDPSSLSLVGGWAQPFVRDLDLPCEFPSKVHRT